MIPIKGFEEQYAVTKEGLIYSIPRTKPSGKVIGGIYLKTHVGTTGYLGVVLNKHGKKYSKQVHTLVATHYLVKPEGRNVEVNHKDGNKLNNHVDNLEWIEHSQNIKHQYTNLGRKMSEKHKEAMMNKIKGVPHTNKRKVDKSIAQSKAFKCADEITRLKAEGLTQSEIAEILSMSSASVGRFLRGELAWQILENT